MAEGLFRELNPGPLAPEARIMPLDQAADCVRVRLPRIDGPDLFVNGSGCGWEPFGLQRSPHWGLNPGPSVYKTDALPLSYRGIPCRKF